MANTYDTLRGRSRLQTSGVSDIMVRMKGIFPQRSLPYANIAPLPISMSCYCTVTAPVGGMDTRGAQSGALKWRHNSNYGMSLATNRFRDRYNINFLLDQFQKSGR
jgi:hypothetical protein